MLARAFHSPLIWNTHSCAQYFIFIKIIKEEHTPWFENAIACDGHELPLMKLESGGKTKAIVFLCHFTCLMIELSLRQTHKFFQKLD